MCACVHVCMCGLDWIGLFKAEGIGSRMIDLDEDLDDNLERCRLSRAMQDMPTFFSIFFCSCCCC